MKPPKAGAQPELEFMEEWREKTGNLDYLDDPQTVELMKAYAAAIRNQEHAHSPEVAAHSDIRNNEALSAEEFYLARYGHELFIEDKLSSHRLLDFSKAYAAHVSQASERRITERLNKGAQEIFLLNRRAETAEKELAEHKEALSTAMNVLKVLRDTNNAGEWVHEVTKEALYRMERDCAALRKSEEALRGESTE